jgi:hypothetical protein
MRNHLWKLISSSFWEIQGPLIGFIGILLGILLWRFPIGTKVSIDWIIWVIFTALLLIITLVRAVSKSCESYLIIKTQNEDYINKSEDMEAKLNRRIIPKILFAKPYKGKTGLEVECLIENSELLSNDTYISFYYTEDDEFERLIGAGVVITVQANGKVQALMDNPITAYKEVLEKLASNDAKILGKTVVKPSVTRSMIQSSI